MSVAKMTIHLKEYMNPSKKKKWSFWKNGITFMRASGGEEAVDIIKKMFEGNKKMLAELDKIEAAQKRI